jgi:hypothetical protein
MNERIDFTTIRRRPRPFHRFELKDSNLPGPVVVQLRRPLVNEIDGANEKADRYIAKFVTGGWNHEITGEFLKDPLVYMVDGEPVILTSTTIRRAAKIEAMQPPDGYSLDQLIEMSQVAEEAWDELEVRSAQVYSGALDEDGAGKDSKGP